MSINAAFVNIENLNVKVEKPGFCKMVLKRSCSVKVLSTLKADWKK